MLETVVIASLLGGLLSLDVLVAFQFMLSRPLVAATLTGAALGEPGAGLCLGSVMELIWAGALPVGSVVPPDFCVASVFAAAAAVTMRHGDPRLGWEACVAWALLWSLPLASFAGRADIWQRRWHSRLARAAEAGLDAGDEGALGRAVLKSAGMSFLKGALITGLALALLVRPMAFVLGRVFSTAAEALDWIYWLGLLLGFMVVMDLFWERKWLQAGAASFAASAIAVYAFGVEGRVVLGAASALALGAATILERRARA